MDNDLYRAIDKVDFLILEMGAWEKSIARTIHSLQYAESQANKLSRELSDVQSLLMKYIEKGDK